jgi:hypothetical protein
MTHIEAFRHTVRRSPIGALVGVGALALIGLGGGGILVSVYYLLEFIFGS